MFPCKQCGACCRSVGQSPLGRDLADVDGVCKYLNRETNLCTIYATRPAICRVDEYYDAHCRGVMSRRAYYRENERVCALLRERLKKS